MATPEMPNRPFPPGSPGNPNPPIPAVEQPTDATILDVGPSFRIDDPQLDEFGDPIDEEKR